MNKTATFTEGFGTGLAGGVATAAALALAHDVVSAIQERKDEDRRRKPKTGKDTIVVHLPPKMSSARDNFADVPGVKSKTVDPNGSKDRDTLGQFTPKWVNKSAANWYATPAAQHVFSALVGAGILSQMPKTQEEASKVLGKSWDRGKTLLGGAAGLALGYTGMRKIHQYLEKKRLEREIAEAQEEYVKSLTKPAYDILSLGTGTEKSAAPYNGHSYNPQDHGTLIEQLDSSTAKGLDASSWAIGGGIATTVLTALALAHVTKKFMDNKYGVPDPDKDKIKRKTRVIFKTDLPGEEKAAEIRPATAIFALDCIKSAMANDDLLEKEASNFGESAVLNNKGELASRDEIRAIAGHNAEEPITAETDARDINTARNIQASKNPWTDMMANEDNARAILDWYAGGQKGNPNVGTWTGFKMKYLHGGEKPQTDEGMRRVFGQAILKNPNLINILNEEKYRTLVDSAADKYLNNYFSPNGQGIGRALSTGWLGSTPLGSWLKQLYSWIFKNTSWGREKGMRRFLDKYTGDTDNVLASARGQAPMVKTQSDKTAQFAAIEEFVANQNINNDIRNKELGEKLDAIADAVVKKTKNNLSYARNSISGADAAAREFIEKHRSLIIRALRDAQESQEQ